MDINQNQLTNTFVKGMNTDTSDMYLSSDQYRYAENVRLTTNTDNNDGELHLIDGVVPTTYTDYFSRIIETTSIRNYCIIIGVKSEETGWSIYCFDKDEELTDSHRIFGPCSEFLEEPLSLVTRWESDNNVKLYIASKGENILSINLKHKDYTNNTPPNTLEYLGVNSNNTLYQPTITVEDGGGTFKSPVVQYSYRLYKLGGQATQVSPLSKLISLSKSEVEGYSPSDVVLKRITININTDGTSEYLNRLQIFRISYVKNGQEPVIDIIYDDIIQNLVSDSGSTIKTINVAEFISLTNIQLKPQIIESKNDYLFAANVIYDQDSIDNIFNNSSMLYELCHLKYQMNVNGAFTQNALNYGRSLKRGETYRYGVVFYTKDGRKTSVKCITDITVPKDKYLDSIYPVGSTQCFYNLDRIGIKFTVTIPDDAKQYCSGYEIVRCDRTIIDSTIIGQGVVGSTFKLDNVNTIRFINPFMTMTNIEYSHDVEPSEIPNTKPNGVLQLITPEYVYDDESTKNIFLNNYGNLKLEDIAYYPTRFEKRILNDTTYYTANKGALFSRNNDDTGIWRLDTFANIPYSLNGSIEYNKNGDFYTIMSQYVNEMSHMFPVQIAESDTNHSVDIENFEFTKSPQYDSFSNLETYTIRDAMYPIQDYNLLNWFATDFYKNGRYDTEVGYYLADIDSGLPPKWGRLYISSGNKSIILACNIPENRYDFLHGWFLPITVVDICKKSTQSPYGGNSDFAKQNSVFYSYGNYKEYNENDTTITVFDGDCYVCMFEFISSHCWLSDRYHSRMCPVAYSVPIESSIDLTKKSGTLFTNNNQAIPQYLQDEPVNIEFGEIRYIQEKPAYSYNKAYNSLPNALSFVPITYTEISTDIYDTRVYYSNKKLNNESIDNWYQFKSANFLDVDSRYGCITDLKLFKDYLLFWQEHASGILSVNERTILQDINNTNIILGNGDTLQRFDYISTLYGMRKGDMSKALSNNHIYWYDYDNKEMLLYTAGTQLIPLKKTKNISNLIDNSDSTDKPKLLWDINNKEILFSVLKTKNNNKSISYSETIQCFTSVYNLPFDFSISFNDKIYFIKDNKIYLRNNNEIQNESKGTIVITSDDKLVQNELTPLIQYVVNNNFAYNKTFDSQLFGGKFYKGSNILEKNNNDKHLISGEHDNNPLKCLTFSYNTPLKLYSSTDGSMVTNREYNYKLNIPRDTEEDYGGRLRGKTMLCELKSSSNSTDFSLQYIITKFRLSWG